MLRLVKKFRLSLWRRHSLNRGVIILHRGMEEVQGGFSFDELPLQGRGCCAILVLSCIKHSESIILPKEEEG